MQDWYDWTYLEKLILWMQRRDSPFRFSILDHEQALKNAFLSAEVPMRGKPRHESEYQRIERWIDANAEISLIGNTVRTRTTIFESVQADKDKVQGWLRANAIEHVEIGDRAQTPVIAAEKMIAQWLAEQPENPPARRDDVFRSAKSGQLIGDLGKKLSYRAFLRAWAAEAPRAWTLPGRRRSAAAFRQLPGAEIETPHKSPRC
jgi:hypothetical protein